MRWWNEHRRSRQRTALVAALCLTLPLVTLPAASAAQVFSGRQQAPPRQGMSTKKKVVLLAGAALAYYLYKKHQARRAEMSSQYAPGQTRQGGTTAARRMPQLYRSKNGGIYYRDQNGRPIWLTTPRRSIQVPVEDVRRYAPDYDQYRGPAPSIPSGARRESFEQFDSSLFESSYSGAGAGTGSRSSLPPGPRRY